MSQPLGENSGEISVGTLGDLVGIPLTNELVELLVLWHRLDSEKQNEVLDFIHASLLKPEMDH